jgi:aspartate 1-decarboxylase
VIIMSFAFLNPDEVSGHASRVVIADKQNRPAETLVHPSIS